MQGYMDDFLPGPSQRLLHLTIITMVAYFAMSCSSQRTPTPAPTVAQPRVEENTSSRDSSDQKSKKDPKDEDEDDEDQDKTTGSSKSGSDAKGGSTSKTPSPSGPVTTPPSMMPSLDPALVKLRAFLNDPEARGNITPAQKAQALASIMGVSDTDLQAALNMQCRPGAT
jgi:hypothetical protein